MIVIVNSANESAHGGLETVHLNIIGPVPLVCVKVAFGLLAFGLNVPVPPLCTVQLPVPLAVVLPPNETVVPSAQMVWFDPTVAVVGD